MSDGHSTLGLNRYSLLLCVVTWILWNWVAIMSFLGAASAAIWGWRKKYDHLQIALAAFAALALVLWTGIGFVWTYDRSVKNSYDWTLAYGGLVLGADTGNPEAALQIGVNLFNVGPAAIKYKVEDLRVVIQDRTIADPKYSNQGG